MAKTYSKGAKLRAKKAGLPDLADVPKREKDGRVKRSTRKDYERSPDQTALKARARQSGKSPSQLSEMRHPAFGEDAGRAIYAVHSGDFANRLWTCYAACSASYKRYLSVCIGAGVDAKTAKIEMMPERFETSASDTPDMRSEEERHRAAANAWYGWRNALVNLTLSHSAAIYAALHGWGQLMDGGRVTENGKRLVEAMEALEGVENQRK